MPARYYVKSYKHFMMMIAVLFLAGCAMFVAADDVCVLEAKVGKCKGSIPRWFYNTKSGKCEEFSYGGCDGNANNFETEEACEQECPKCNLPAEAGMCQAYFKRFFYDSASGECKEFIYGGCQGNSNNFQTMNDCNKACSD